MMKYFSTLVVSILICIAVLIPGSKIPDVGFWGLDKLVHFIMFYTWCLAVQFDFEKSFKWVAVLFSGIVFSILTEVLQIFAEDRSFDVYDMITDSIGIIIGLLTGTFALKIISRLWPLTLLKSYHDK